MSGRISFVVEEVFADVIRVELNPQPLPPKINPQPLPPGKS
jgi:hypothetical protein